MKSGWPEKLLAWAVRQMPEGRQEWGAAMLAELAQVEDATARRQFALGCARVALFAPEPGGYRVMLKGVLFLLVAAALIAFVLLQPETGGLWLAQAISAHTFVLIFSTALQGSMLLLVAITWGMVRKARGRQPWLRVPAPVRRWGRLAIEVYYCLLNPVLYLTILGSWLPIRRLHTEWLQAAWWLGPLLTLATALLAVGWTWRLCGAAFYPASRPARLGLQALLLASMACVLAFAAKDVTMLWTPGKGDASPGGLLLLLVSMSPLYLLPLVLLYDHWRTVAQADAEEVRRFFLFSSPAARIVVVGLLAASIAAFVLAAQRRPEENVRALVGQHRAAIQTAAARYDVDARLLGAIVYVTHRDQLSPFRDSIERMFSIAWVIGLPDKSLNQALDISLGLAQIKPRTARTASVLATGRLTPPKEGFGYYELEPLGAGWPPVATQLVMPSPIPVSAERDAVVRTLLQPKTNLETCALILALYQKQWESANPAWSIRARPDILATLYQIGFGRSRPHAAPQSNAFGARVREVYGERWLGELMESR